MKLLYISVFSLFTIAASAQSKIGFSSRNYVGLLEGEHGSAFQLQSINGVKCQTWFAGLGTGIDWYYRRSIPLFASVNKDFLRKANRAFYVTADAGANFPWNNNNYNTWGYTIDKSYPGLYWSAGLGYKIGVGKKNDALLIHLGYSSKHVREKVKTIYYYYTYSILPPSEQQDFTNRFDYYLRSVSIKVGWNF